MAAAAAAMVVVKEEAVVLAVAMVDEAGLGAVAVEAGCRVSRRRWHQESRHGMLHQDHHMSRWQTAGMSRELGKSAQG